MKIENLSFFVIKHCWFVLINDGLNILAVILFCSRWRYKCQKLVRNEQVKERRRDFKLRQMHFNFTFLTTLKQGSHATDLCVDTREESPFYSRRFELQKKKKKKMNAPIMQCSNNFTRFCYLSFTKLSFQSKTTFCLHLYFKIKSLCYYLEPKTKFVIDYKKVANLTKLIVKLFWKLEKIVSSRQMSKMRLQLRLQVGSTWMRVVDLFGSCFTQKSTMTWLHGESRAVAVELTDDSAVPRTFPGYTMVFTWRRIPRGRVCACAMGGHLTNYKFYNVAGPTFFRPGTISFSFFFILWLILMPLIFLYPIVGEIFRVFPVRIFIYSVISNWK